MQQGASQKEGITLIEIMIAITVLSIGILGLLQAFPRGTAASRVVELSVAANQLAQEKLESFAATAYEDIAAGMLEDGVRVSVDSQSPFYDFLRTTTVALLDANLAEAQTDLGLKKITVTVEWPYPIGGGTGSNTLITLRSR
ncbi:MAG: prepilin-type N-terminal cleavage/methylation domain-containing protein [Parcubacteria group bacterium]|nr:prepilin-type N-terminal cleavage/methylation domain-containing protein [Parcubacteria group bacterium]